MKLRFVLYTLVLALTAVGCARDINVDDVSVASEETVALQQATDGQEYFAGIFLMQGEYAGQIDMYREYLGYESQLSADELRLRAQFTDQVLAGIHEADATFFDRFEEAVESGNQPRIATAMREGGELLMTVLRESPRFQTIVDQLNVDNLKTEDYINEDGSVNEDRIMAKSKELEGILANNIIADQGGGVDALAPCSWAVACVFYAAVVAHNTVAVTANLAVALAVWKWVGVVDAGVAITGSTDPMHMEMLINQIAATQ